MKTLALFLFFLLGTFDFAKADTVDNFQIYRNKTLILNDSGLGSERATVNLLRFSQRDINDSLMINFNHCTPAATRRKIVLLSKSKRQLATWMFPDKNIENLMAVPIIKLWQVIKKNPGEEFDLFYFDQQLQNGMFLSSVGIKSP